MRAKAGRERDRVSRSEILRVAARQVDDDVLDHGPPSRIADRAPPGVRLRACRRAMAPMRPELFLLAVSAELAEVGPKVLDLLGVAHARKGHAGAGDLLHRVADVLLEQGLVPGDPGVLDRVRIVIALEGAG